MRAASARAVRWIGTRHSSVSSSGSCRLQQALCARTAPHRRAHRIASHFCDCDLCRRLQSRLRGPAGYNQSVAIGIYGPVPFTLHSAAAVRNG